MNTFAPYIVESTCILKGGDTADRRMMELNLLIASGKGNVRPANPLRTRMQVLKDKHSNSEVQLIDTFVRAVAEYRKAGRKRGRPDPAADFAVLRREIESLATARHTWRIDWEEIDTRKWGRQRWPVRLGFDSIEDLATALGRSDELRSFRAALQEARERCPALEPWLRAKAHRIVDHLADWRGLVAVCACFAAHPQPRCYPRQVPVPVGTKFIEEHAGILRELLDVVVGDSVNAAAATFAERFDLLVEPPQVRFRFLDPELRTCICWPVADCSIPAPALADLKWNIPRRREPRCVFVPTQSSGHFGCIRLGQGIIAFAPLPMDEHIGNRVLGRLRRSWIWHPVRFAFELSTCAKCANG
jgi:hypothetical protein